MLWWNLYRRWLDDLCLLRQLQLPTALIYRSCADLNFNRFFFLWAKLLYILRFYLLWTLLWLSSDLFVVVGFGFVMVIVKVYSYLFFYCSEYDYGFVYFYCYLILVIDIYMDIVMFTFSRNFYIYIK